MSGNKKHAAAKSSNMNMLQKFEAKQIAEISDTREIPKFSYGDVVRVNVRIVEGTNERIQAFEGLCIAIKNRGLHSAFTVRKISHGEGVEKTFQLHSPRIDSISLVRRGIVRRAKLYYLRERSGKSARITEKLDFSKKSKSDKKGTVSKNPKLAEDSKKSAEQKDIDKTENKAKNHENYENRENKDQKLVQSDNPVKSDNKDQKDNK